MATHILASRADSTVSKYSSQCRAFKDFCREKGFSTEPAHPIHTAMYLSCLIDQGKSDSVVTAALYGIKWYHNINDYPDPTENVIVKNIVECAKRNNSKPTQRKDVVTTTHLISLCSMFDRTSDVIHLRDLTMIVLCFSGFLRFNELSELRCCDVTVNSDHMILFIRKSKVDIYREGRHVYIAKGSTAACPITLLQRYMNVAGLLLRSQEFLFKPACRSGSKCFLLKKDKKISYSRARECIVSKLKLVAPDLKLGTHSLRASGASTAASDGTVSERCIKRHGRWKSEKSKDMYIQESLDHKLQVTKKLKL